MTLDKLITSTIDLGVACACLVTAYAKLAEVMPAEDAVFVIALSAIAGASMTFFITDF